MHTEYYKSYWFTSGEYWEDATPEHTREDLKQQLKNTWY